MPTFSILLPLVPLTVGQAVDRSAWPAHITLVGNFRALDGADAAAVLRRFAAGVPPVSTTVENEALFGSDGTVLVDLVEATRLLDLHGLLLDELEAEVAGLEPIDPHHTRTGFRPHRTVAPGPRPSRGDVLEASSVALVELDPPGSPGTAVVLGRWPLEGARQQR